MSTFAGEQPDYYDRYLVPAIFDPYAAHVAALLAAQQPGRVLELAAGTGAGTRALADAVPGCEIVATDLSPDMLARAAARVDDPRVSFVEADAQDLPFPDASFDAAQFLFGIMFVPDRVRALREVRRVLRPGGLLVMTSWDAAGTSATHAPVDDAVVRVFADDESLTGRRPAHSYHDVARIGADVRSAGFTDVDVRPVTLIGRATANDLAWGYGRGSGLATTAREQGIAVEQVVAALRDAFRAHLGDGPFDLSLSAIVTTAR